MISLFLSNETSDPLSDWWYQSAIGTRSAAGVAVTNDVAMTYSAVWACTRLLSATGSYLPLNLIRQDGTQRVVATDHRVHELIHSLPNPEMSSMSLRSVGINHQVNRGNFYAEIQRDILGTARALWPILVPVDAERANEQQASDLGVNPGELIWKIRNEGKPATYLPDRDVFHVSSTVTDTGIVGKGVITNARESIGLGIATEQQGGAYMKNSSRPAVVVKGGKFKTPEDREFYRNSFMEVHGGALNNGKPAMLPEGADISTLSFSPEDSQFLQTRQHNVEEICRWYGVPPHMVQHLLRATFNNIEHQGIEFVVYSLIPWLKMWEDEIWRKLLTPSERKTMYAKHNVDALLRGDTAARSAFYKTLWELGVLNANEIREREDWNPIGEIGDKRFVQTSYTATENLNIGDWKSAREKNDITRDEFRARVLALPASTNQDDAPLLSNVGGLTGTVAVAQAVGKGEMSADAGAELLSLFLKIEQERAAKIAGEKLAQPADNPPPAIPPTLATAPAATDTMPSLASLAARESAVRGAATLLLSETCGRMLSRECIALSRAASKPPAEFFTWLDTFYLEHSAVMVEALEKPMAIYDLTHGRSGSELGVRAAIDAHVTRSREAVLKLTEIQPDQWGTIPEKLKRLADSWRGIEMFPNWRK